MLNCLPEYEITNVFCLVSFFFPDEAYSPHPTPQHCVSIAVSLDTLSCSLNANVLSCQKRECSFKLDQTGPELGPGRV